MKLSNLAVLALAACAMAAVGCDKEMKVTFVNVSDQSLPVELKVANSPSWPIGTVPADGGKLRHKFTVDGDDMPATCVYSAGGKTGSFMVTKNSPSELWVDIGLKGETRVRDSKMEVNEKREVEVKKVKVHQGEVVE
jgi:hypothetical protein